MSIDENGNSDLKGVTRALRKGHDVPEADRHFTVTGVILRRADFPRLRDRFLELKTTYWDDGKFSYPGKGLRRVCFHSREIRKREGPFAGDEFDYDGFLNDLTAVLRDTPATIIASSIDRVRHVQTYPDPYHPYELCMTFVLERFAMFLNRRRATGLVLLESRGKKEDKFLLTHITRVLDNGTYYCPVSHFENIVGVYFNPKWSERDGFQASYVSLELADLCSHPIHTFAWTGNRNRAFQVLEPKLDGYPHYVGKGLKVFPPLAKEKTATARTLGGRPG